MKKVLFTFLLSAISHAFTNAQLTTEDSIGITRERWRDSIFRMDKQLVPSGILPEYSMFCRCWYFPESSTPSLV